MCFLGSVRGHCGQYGRVWAWSRSRLGLTHWITVTLDRSALGFCIRQGGRTGHLSSQVSCEALLRDV